ncbi:hypothetical protein ACWEKT_29565 [Nocardia takedensis]
MSAVTEAFRRARIHAFRHMSECERARLHWGETTITEMVTAHASRAVTVVPFTQRAEARSGADWIWWWVDDTAAYGMLVQAKRVTVTGRGWSFDFGYRAAGWRDEFATKGSPDGCGAAGASARLRALPRDR